MIPDLDFLRADSLAAFCQHSPATGQVIITGTGAKVFLAGWNLAILEFSEGGLILVVQLRDTVWANFIRYENLGRHPARTHPGNYVDSAPACVGWCGCRVHHMSLCEKFSMHVILADYVEGYVHDSKTV